MAEPSDVDLVRSAIRLGWGVAEVRGRSRPDGPDGGAVAVPLRVGHPLPLRVERSVTEQRLEAQAVLSALASKLGVNASAKHSNFGQEIDDQAKALWQMRQAT